MKGILVPESATYIGLIELVRSAIGIRGPAKTIVMRYSVEPGLPLVRIQCDADVKFYIQLKKKDVHMLNKFPITIDILDESAAEAMPPELGESNHIDIRFPIKAVQSDEAIQHVDDRNWTFPPHIPPLPPHVDESKFAGDARQSNENSIAVSIGAHYIANYTTSQSVNVPSSDSVSGSLVVADYTPVTIHINSIFENKKLLQYHLHHDAMSKHYQFKMKRSNSTLLHVICIDIEKYQWQLRETRMRGSELFIVKRYDDVHTCSIEIVQGHHRQAKSWMIREAWRGKEAALTNLKGDDAESYNVLSAWVEMVKRKNHGSNIDIETNSENCLQCFYMCLAASKHGWPYCRPVIVVDGSALKSKFGGMLLAACSHNANGCIFPLAFSIIQSESNESWKWFFEKLRASISTRESLAIVADRYKGIEVASNLVYPDAAFRICVQHLAANLKTKYKDFKGPLKTYFDGAERSYLVSEHQRHMESIRNRNPDMHRYLVQADPTKWSRAYFNGRRYAIMTTNIAESLNNVDRKARLMPVGFLVEWLRELQQRWFVARREEAIKLTSKLAPKAEKLIRTNFSVGLLVTSIILAAQMAGMFLKKSGRKLSILQKQSVGPEGHGLEGFCLKEKNISLFGVVDVIVMDITDKPVPIQYP
ncbi:hypothetical protein TIFTF001_052906 [Ficus carica]|uniref:MULE transposase domain-containing protein n=1 Tax=Ficus carica TaxID=3494 RepID=A0AA88EDG8_FICCA|nr:hypothetical protein TIFTF001_052903 [Ficus carica]GMN72750.1 hypothetical protein TIFTF001_052904 [Ficus carica]GMN72755.1 hypothetical protein TIFTF001_052905 [Ficus carica]GMN72762.1 hypothetical protein TIFTF001_052906 [Ficus carica]